MGFFIAIRGATMLGAGRDDFFAAMRDAGRVNLIPENTRGRPVRPGAESPDEKTPPAPLFRGEEERG